jgi:hypothetical protein
MRSTDCLPASKLRAMHSPEAANPPGPHYPSHALILSLSRKVICVDRVVEDEDIVMKH